MYACVCGSRIHAQISNYMVIGGESSSLVCRSPGVFRGSTKESQNWLVWEGCCVCIVLVLGMCIISD